MGYVSVCLVMLSYVFPYRCVSLRRHISSKLGLLLVYVLDVDWIVGGASKSIKARARYVKGSLPLISAAFAD